MSALTASNFGSFPVNIIPDPPVLEGSIVGFDVWTFRIAEHDSPLTACTSPDDAVRRARCLRALTTGLSTSYITLFRAFNNDATRVPEKNKDDIGMSSDSDRLVYYDYLTQLRRKYTLAQDKLKYRHSAGPKALFLNECLLVNAMAIRLIVNRMMATSHAAYIQAMGRHNQAVELEVQLRRWDQQFARKMAKFCSRHPWLKFDLENTFNAVSPERQSNQQPIVILPDADGKIISKLSGLSEAGVDCPICTEELYVGPSDDLVEEDSVLNEEPVQDVATLSPFSHCGEIFKCVDARLWPLQGATTRFREFMEYIARIFWRSDFEPSTPISTPMPVLKYDYTRECITGCIEQANIDFWEASDSEDNALPKPIFCPECLDHWVVNEGDDGWFRLTCPFCRADFSPDFADKKIWPAVGAERRRVRLEQRRLAHHHH